MSFKSVKAKIAIADDHALFRKGVIKLLDTDQFEVLFDVGNGEELIEKIKADTINLPDIIIMDIEMPGMNGYVAVAWLKDHYPDIKILVVSMVGREDAILKMLKLGVKGYLSKEIEPQDLYAALRSIIQGNYYFTDYVTNKLIHSLQREDGKSLEQNDNSLSNNDLWNQLNDRQKEYVRHACTELTYDEIAVKMSVSPKTIDGYRDAVFNKFNIKNRVGLVLFAIRNGFISV